ncbi:MAG: FliO/MopB family protein [Treponema sp.]
MKSSYNGLVKFILVLLISFIPFLLNCEVSNAVDEKKVESFTEATPIDITGEAEKKSDEASSALLDEFTLKNGSETVSYTSNIFRLVLSLIFVVFLAYVVIKLMKKSKLFVVNNDSYLKLVAQLGIEQGKSIKVFTLGEKAYIIGVAGNNITKIAEIEDKVLIDAMNLNANDNYKAEVTSFSKVFSSFFPTVKQTKITEEKIFNDKFLKNQQERIKNMNIKSE